MNTLPVTPEVKNALNRLCDLAEYGGGHADDKKAAQIIRSQLSTMTYPKLASAIDKISDSLETKGLIKEAYELDKIADLIDTQDQPTSFTLFSTLSPEQVPKAKMILKKLNIGPDVAWIAQNANIYNPHAKGPGIVGLPTADLTSFWNEMKK